MTWDQMLDIPIEEATTGQVLTDIECPECGRKIYLDTGIILTSYPAKYHYWCTCGWSDCSHIRWFAGLSGEAKVWIAIIVSVLCVAMVALVATFVVDTIKGWKK